MGSLYAPPRKRNWELGLLLWTFVDSGTAGATRLHYVRNVTRGYYTVYGPD